MCYKRTQFHFCMSQQGMTYNMYRWHIKRSFWWVVPKCVLLLGGGDGSTGISSFLFSHHSTPPPSPVYSLCPLLCTSSLEYHYPTTSTFNFLHPFQKPLSLSHWNSLHLTKKCSISSTSPLPHSTHLSSFAISHLSIISISMTLTTPM